MALCHCSAAVPLAWDLGVWGTACWGVPEVLGVQGGRVVLMGGQFERLQVVLQVALMVAHWEDPSGVLEVQEAH